MTGEAHGPEVSARALNSHLREAHWRGGREARLSAVLGEQSRASKLELETGSDLQTSLPPVVRVSKSRALRERKKEVRCSLVRTTP